MATNNRTLRRGLPRTPGGEPWPPARAGDAIPAGPDSQVQDIAPVATAAAPVAPPTAPETTAPADVAEAPAPAADATAGAAAEGTTRAVRRGLPRTPGGEPWPAAGVVPVSAAAQRAATADAPAAPAPSESATAPAATAPPAAAPAAAPAVSSSASGPSRTVAVRRGLPRTPGGDPWPAEGTVELAAPGPAEQPEDAAPENIAVAAQEAEAPKAAAEVPAAQEAATPQAFGEAQAPAEAPAAAKAPAPAPAPAAAPAPAKVPAAANAAAPKAEPKGLDRFTREHWVGAAAGAGGVVALIAVAALAVLGVRWLLGTEPLQDFMQTYPGEYHLPEGAPVGFPAWLAWQHFFNFFLMVLIIRSGLQVRTEKRPSAYWTGRGEGKNKISLNLWFHQSLDILWLVNGVLFVVLLFATGQWMRVVPTSWEVFPNALSAGLQYVSLDWPTENGWVNYNSLQQIAYFVTIFIAAPLAAVTGARMSGIWPKNAKKLNELYPVEWARALHFPTMIYFVVFIFIHVALVLSTGALRNLNHMYAAQGSVNPTEYADNWVGFWLFVASLAVIVVAWLAARPLVLAPIARLFGKVTAR